MFKLIFPLIVLTCFFNESKSQDLYDINTLRTIHISFHNDDYHDILVDNWFAETGYRELADMEMDGVLYKDVAIRYKGNATFFIANDNDNPKIPLNIDMNDVNSELDLLGYKKIKLASSLFDPTMLRDVMGFEIYRNYMPAPEANWMKVYIDSAYIGLYPNTESINKKFLKKHFDYKKGALVKCDPASQFGTSVPWQSSDLAWYGPDTSTYLSRYQMKTDFGWSEFVHMLDVLNNSPEDLEEVLNIDRAIWNLAVSTTVANHDSYAGFYMHNYYMYEHENGLFQMLPWDLSEVFVGILLANNELTEDQVYEWDIFLEEDPFMEQRPLLRYISDHPVYRKQYVAHIRTIMDEILNVEDVLARAEEMQELISEAAIEDVNTFFGLSSLFFESSVTEDVDFFGLNVAGMTPTVDKRRKYLEAHPEISSLPPSITNTKSLPEIPVSNNPTFITAYVENASEVDLMVTKNKWASHFQKVTMMDDGQHGDGTANDNVYGAEVPFNESGDDIKYYIRAQNDEAMMLDPQRAEYEFHVYTVEETVSSIEQVASSNWVLSPNPSTGIVYITMDQTESGQEKNIEITDVEGKKYAFRNANFIEGSYQLDLSNYKQGVYIIEIKGYSSQKLIISK